MRRQFTIQLYDAPVHAHICPECDKHIPCRLPCCSIVSIGPELECDLGYERACQPCMDLAGLDVVVIVAIAWCEHCGGDLVRVNHPMPKHWASEPHDAWCSVGIEAAGHALPSPLAPVRVEHGPFGTAITACVDIFPGDMLVLRGVPTEVIGVALESAEAGKRVVVKLT